MPEEPYPIEPRPDSPAPELPVQYGEAPLPVSSWLDEHAPASLPTPRADLPASELEEGGFDDELPDVELPDELMSALEDPSAPLSAPGEQAFSQAPPESLADAPSSPRSSEEAELDDAPEIPDATLDRLVAQDEAAPSTAFGRWRSERRADPRPQLAELEATVLARTEELQRLQAEFQNYRKRIARERDADAQRITGEVLSELLPVLDDLARVQAHGDLQGPLVGITDSLLQTLTRLGLERFGEPGDLFDPTVHEALQHTFSLDVTETVCAEVYMAGYSHEGRLLRPARVHVAEPDPDLPLLPDEE